MAATFLLLLLVIIAILLLVSRARRGTRVRRSRGLSIKVNFIIAGCYLAVLVILTAVCYVLPAGPLIPAADPEKAMQTIEDGDAALRQSIRDGSFDAPESFDKTISSFDFTGSHIDIQADSMLYIYKSVYVGTKGVDAPDNGSTTIDVYSYLGGYGVLRGQYYNFLTSEHPIVELPRQTLYLKQPPRLELEFYKFDDKDAVPFFFQGDQPDYNFSRSGFQCVIVMLPPGVTYTGDGTEPLSNFLNSPQ